MTSRYGWKQADNEIDQVMSATMVGTMALCAIIFDAVAIRLWVCGWRSAGLFIGVIACLAFVVTFSNSLGSILPRSDAVEAKLIATNPDRRPVGSVKRILTVHLESAPGDQVEIADIGNRYRDVCRRVGKRTMTSDEFCTELDDFCRTVSIKRKKAGEHVYLLDVRLASVAAEHTNVS